MSDLTFSTSEFQRFFIIFLAFLLASTTSSANDVPGEEASTQRVFLADVGSECFETFFLERGFFFIEASVPSSAPVEPRIDFAGDLSDASFTYLERLAASLVVEIHEPGTYGFCLGAQDPDKPLGETRVTSGFSAHALDLKDDDPDVVEEEPDTTPKCVLEIHDPPPAERAVSKLCRALEIDDHADVLRCATALDLGQHLEAEIDNGRGDDEDVFKIVVGELTTLRLETTGTLATLGALYDRYGHRLHVKPDTGDAGWRIVKTLSPGTYFLKVAARFGEQGTYYLNATALVH